jgi:hypothetical protein
MEANGQLHAPTSLTLGKCPPVPTGWGFSVGLGTVAKRKKIPSLPCRETNLCLWLHSLVTILTELSRLLNIIIIFNIYIYICRRRNGGGGVEIKIHEFLTSSLYLPRAVPCFNFEPPFLWRKSPWCRFDRWLAESQSHFLRVGEECKSKTQQEWHPRRPVRGPTLYQLTTTHKHCNKIAIKFSYNFRVYTIKANSVLLSALAWKNMGSATILLHSVYDKFSLKTYILSDINFHEIIQNSLCSVVAFS